MTVPGSGLELKLERVDNKRGMAGAAAVGMAVGLAVMPGATLSLTWTWPC